MTARDAQVMSTKAVPPHEHTHTYDKRKKVIILVILYTSRNDRNCAAKIVCLCIVKKVFVTFE